MLHQQYTYLYVLQCSQVGPVCEALLPHGSDVDHRNHFVGCGRSRLLLVHNRHCQHAASSLHICNLLLQEKCAKPSESSFGIIPTLCKENDSWKKWHVCVWPYQFSPADNQHQKEHQRIKSRYLTICSSQLLSFSVAKVSYV